jgi:hypothetical protein
LNAGVSGAGHVGSRVYLGGGVSAMPALNFNTFAVYPIEITEAYAFARWAPASAVQLDAGLRVAVVEDLHICVFNPCSATYDTLFGPFAGIHVGPRHFKLGPRVAYAVRAHSGEWGAMLYPLVLRLQFMP